MPNICIWNRTVRSTNVLQQGKRYTESSVQVEKYFENERGQDRRGGMGLEGVVHPEKKKILCFLIWDKTK